MSMIDDDNQSMSVMHALRERAKELTCLYKVEDILRSGSGRSVEEVLREIVVNLPAAWQYPEACVARILYGTTSIEPLGFRTSAWVQSADICVNGSQMGRVEVFYTEAMPEWDEGPFLKEERQLIDTIAERIALHVRQRRSEAEQHDKGGAGVDVSEKHEWEVIVEFLRETDPVLLKRISRKLVNHLSWSGVAEARELLQPRVTRGTIESVAGEENRPIPRVHPVARDLSSDAFDIARHHLGDLEILNLVTTWIKEDRVSFLVRALEGQDTSLGEIIAALERFRHTAIDEGELSLATRKGLRVSLIRRFFTDSVQFINVAEEFVDVKDFDELIGNVIYPTGCHGKLGGKSAGLFLAKKIIDKSPEATPALRKIKVPRSWYVTSDWILHFVHHNDLEEVLSRKYSEIDRIRDEYPHLVALFKNSSFPLELLKGLAGVLDALGDSPIIIRSSSLLEDRYDSAFSGKYKSLFLGNQGTKEERLAALTDAIAEVYASIFGPDPTEYRTERGLLHVHEEMGVMIQEVVGQKVGKYFLPACSGVAFSNNEFRWSPRIRRGDGLIRLVPGLGTRAVDRIGDDYPVLIAPGQPSLRANVTVEEIVKYSPRKIDVIDLEKNAFETVDVYDLIHEVGQDYPDFERMVSIVDGDWISQPIGIPDLTRKDVVFTFEGLIGQTGFVSQIRDLLTLLQSKLRTPVDLEFAFDGRDLYLVQCRPESFGPETSPAPIPQNLPEESVVFSARRFISNGKVPDVTHIVYVGASEYSQLDATQMRDVGRAVSRLNKLLPKRQFILIGPGRWGSRGDIRLGVPVTYSDINNTSMLIEVAWQRGNYLPDLSFGTHFFQDLVEASIRYLPLYPDDEGVRFHKEFLTKAHNLLPEMLPEFQHLASTLRVIDVPRETGGSIVRVLMNAELEQAVAHFSSPTTQGATEAAEGSLEKPADDHWRWRIRMVERIAAQLEAPRFGVQGFYLIGSTKNGTAGPASDIDIMLHVRSNEQQREKLLLWLQGWNGCLSELNFLRTGYRNDRLLDVRLITDEDIAERNSFAAKIGAVTDPARRLPTKNEL